MTADQESKPERRRAKRFAMELPVKVKAQHGTERECVTRDISNGGVFLYCDFEVAPNSPIQLTLVLPSEITGDEKKWVCCYGRVARVEGSVGGGRRGVAIETERIVFLPEIAGI